MVEVAGWGLDRHVPELGRTLGEELLEPTRVYAADCLALARATPPAGVHAFSHVTGGGLAANLARVLPAGLVADVDRGGVDACRRSSSSCAGLGDVPWADLENTLNLGVGMVAVVAHRTARTPRSRTLASWACRRGCSVACAADDGATGAGGIVSGTKGVRGGAVRLTGRYRTA